MNLLHTDLTNCDTEPIHILGQIQGHGFLIAIDTQSFLITCISANAAAAIPALTASSMGRHIDEFEALKITDMQTSLHFSQLLSLGQIRGFESTNPFSIDINNVAYSLIVSISGNNYLLEFEKTSAEKRHDIQKVIGRSVSQILSKASIPSLLQSAAHEVKHLIGFDRVMVYKFDQDGHGEVIAEEKAEALEPFLGLHYPASDIPKQARELYKINLVRIIADVHSDTAAILTTPDNDLPLDLTHSVLRAVSPMHIQYLKNMGVASSFSISLLVQGELWGLIACHHYTPKFIEYSVRDASKLIGQILSSALEYRQGEKDSDNFAQLNDTVNRLVEYIQKDDDVTKALTTNNVTIRDITSGNGASLVFGEVITSIGTTPDDGQVKVMVQWLKENMVDGIFSTHQFPGIFSPKPYCHVACGVLACIISQDPWEMILWYKPEQIRQVNWAGNPDKPVETSADGLMQISPRKSFASWTEIVKHTAEKWTRAEIAAVINIREQISYAIKRKGHEIRKLNERLKVAYDEINTFSFTVSHDLRTPLSAVKSYAQILLATNSSLDENAQMILQRINLCADKMALLINEILNYSSIGENHIAIVPINMQHLLDAVKADVFEALQPQQIDFVVGNTPAIAGDVVMMKQVFTNLISNAVKYSSKAALPAVKIEGGVREKEVVYSIADNGIGIDVNYYDNVFQLFKRMDNVKDFEGSGVGLAIVKRIMDKHQGRVWFESTLGSGTVFYISLPTTN